jgi:hypothetical protein
MNGLSDITLSHVQSEDEMAHDWSLSNDDVKKIIRCRKPIPRLHWAVQLCVLRKYGRFLSPFFIPLKIANYIHSQIGLPPVFIDISDEPNWKTKFDHATQISEYCGYLQFKSSHSDKLMAHLISLVNAGIDHGELFNICLKFLFDKKVLPPGESIMQRIIRSAIDRAEKNVIENIYNRLTDSIKIKIDELLNVENGLRISTLIKYREYPGAPRPDHILEFINRYEELKIIGATTINLVGLNTEIIFQFYSLVLVYDVFRLKRFNDKKRYSLVACFLSESSKIILDYIVEMNDQYLTSMCRRARHAYENEHREFRKKAKQGIDTVVLAMDDLLGADISIEMTIVDWLKLNNLANLKNAMSDLKTFKMY